MSDSPSEPTTPETPPRSPLSALLTALTVGLIIVIGIVLLQRIGVIGGTPIDAKVASAIIGSTPTMQPNKKNMNAYLSKDDPSVHIDDLGPNNWKIIDIHEHAQTMEEAERLLAAMDKFGIQRTCLMSATIYTFTLNNKYGFEQYKENNDVLLKIKERWPDRFCAFITIDPLEPDHLAQVKDYVARGADGVKLYLGHGASTGKGPFHVMPIDDDRMDPFWSFAEETQLPVLMHVNLTKYWDETIATLEKHPYLRLCLPHFGLHKNTEARLQRLGWIFDRYPNTFTDVSYGYYTFHVEGFEALAKWRTRSRDYLARYADRIMFASDMVLEPTKDVPYIENTLRSYRQFHELDKLRLFIVPSATMHGMGLAPDVLKKLYEDSGKRYLLIDEAGRMPDRTKNPVVEAPRPALPPLDKESIPDDPGYRHRREGETFASARSLERGPQKASPRTSGGGGEGPEAMPNGEAGDGDVGEAVFDEHDPDFDEHECH